MSKPGCCCKSANEPNPNCPYCGSKKQVYYNDQYQPSYVENQGYDKPNQNFNRPGCCCKNANEPSPDCVYCRNKTQGYYNNQNQYGYGQNQGYNQGSNYSQPQPTKSQYSDVNSNNSSWSLLKPVLVFGAGCYVTSKMVTVASELG